MKNNNELYTILKNITLEEFINVFNYSNNQKVEKLNQNVELETSKNNTKILYTINELIEKYPFFTRYNINKAIQNNGLPYCSIGNKRLFNKEEIDKWLEKETKAKRDRIKYDI